MAKPSKPKKVSYQLIPAQSETGKPIYRMLREIVEADHEELRDANIVLGWCTAWRPDVDGNEILGQTKRASDLDRELAAYDFIILLNRPLWLDDRLDEHKRRAILDGLVCYADVKLDKHLEPVVDERGRKVYRKRREDFRGFRSNVDRYGIYSDQLAALAKSLAASRPQRLAKQAELMVAECTECGGSTYRDVSVGGVSRVVRCRCFTEARAIATNRQQLAETVQ